MNKYYLAVDIGASSGRHMLAWVEDGLIRMEEIHRFSNGMAKKDGHLCWDYEKLFGDIVAGLKKCKELGKIPVSMGIDTWGVDYALLDAEGQVLGHTYGYRDSRTNGMDEVLSNIISPEDLYARTGIQKQMFNTIYQLMATKTQEPELLDAADKLLMVPDYLNFLLTGVAKSEYTEATTAQLVNPETKDWDYELLEMMGIKTEMFEPLTTAGTRVGGLKPELVEEIGFDLDVLQIASHDTASAVMAVPSMGKETVYISSGTWSLMGVENREAICTEESRKANLTNEGGYEYRYRFLKNIMGLWMIQSVRHEYEDKYSFAELCAMAEAVKDFPSRVDVNDDCFFAPDSMIGAIKEYCEKSGQPVPQTPGEVSTVVYQSLADSYGQTVQEIQAITGKDYEAINIVGG
ncbi:MAG: rhamnulokinase, partial [Lachnospiraceae bacterium]|nr:rhamnulokinase [Lachnospiraceae bacterium]